MIENKFNKIVKRHDERMHKIATHERRQKWGDLYTEAVKLIEDLAKLEEENLKLRNKINLIGSTL